MNDLIIMALHEYYYYFKYLLNMLILRNGFICLIQINTYFYQMFEGRITGNKVEEEHFNSEVFLSLECRLS